jgi:hypothetical protein
LQARCPRCPPLTSWRQAHHNDNGAFQHHSSTPYCHLSLPTGHCQSTRVANRRASALSDWTARGLPVGTCCLAGGLSVWGGSPFLFPGVGTNRLMPAGGFQSRQVGFPFPASSFHLPRQKNNKKNGPDHQAGRGGKARQGRTFFNPFPAQGPKNNNPLCGFCGVKGTTLPNCGVIPVSTFQPPAPNFQFPVSHSQCTSSFQFAAGSFQFPIGNPWILSDSPQIP